MKFPHFANCSSGSYQGLIPNKTTKSVTRKGSRFFVLRYKSLRICDIFLREAICVLHAICLLRKRGFVSHRVALGQHIAYERCECISHLISSNISRFALQNISPSLCFRNAKISLCQRQNITILSNELSQLNLILNYNNNYGKLNSAKLTEYV